jgi:hypothetical protein
MNVDTRKSIHIRSFRFPFIRLGFRKPTGTTKAHASVNPTGVYIHLGDSGIYYGRQTDWKLVDTGTSPDSTQSGSGINDDSRTEANGLVTSSTEEVAAQINALARRRTYTHLIVILATLVALGLAVLAFVFRPTIIGSYGQAGYGAFILLLVGSLLVWSAGLGLAWFSHRQAQATRNITFRYSLDPDATKLFDAVEKALVSLNQSSRFWHVVAPVPDWDWQHNIGTSSVVKRKRVKVDLVDPPALQLGVKTYCINLGARQVYFLPDQVLVYTDGRFSAVHIPYLNARYYPTRYIEKWRTPKDAVSVKHAWEPLYPDARAARRFWQRWQKPIVHYGQVDLTSSSGMAIHFQVSNPAIAEQFVQALSAYTRYCQKPRAIAFPNVWAWAEGQGESDAAKQSGVDSHAGARDADPYEVLGVAPGTTLDGIGVAFRKLAQQYHPDRVTDLAPELRDLAEKRMKAINIAYQQLKREANVRWT